MLPDAGPIDRMHRRLQTHRDRLETLLRGVAGGRGTPEEFHEWHRELRRLRIDGRVWVVLVPRGRSAGYEETDRGLRALARRIGSVRNLDVGLDLVRRLADERRSSLLVGDAAFLRRALERRARSGRRALARDTGRPPISRLRDGFDRPLRASLPRAAGDRLKETIDETVTVGLARLERALARVYRKPSIARLHRLRIALRSLRAVDQTRRFALGVPPLPVAPGLRALQTELGRLHDVDVLRDESRGALAGRRRDRVLRSLDREGRTLRRRLTRRLGRKPLRREWERLIAAGPD